MLKCTLNKRNAHIQLFSLYGFVHHNWNSWLLKLLFIMYIVKCMHCQSLSHVLTKMAVSYENNNIRSYNLLPVWKLDTDTLFSYISYSTKPLLMCVCTKLKQLIQHSTVTCRKGWGGAGMYYVSHVRWKAPKSHL